MELQRLLMTEHANTGQDFLIRRQVQATDLRDAIHAHYAAAEPACMRDLMQLLVLLVESQLYQVLVPESEL